MISFLRRSSSKTLIALSGALVVLVAGGAVVASGAAGGAGTPPNKSLAQAVAGAFAGPKIEGVSARITFTNKLIDTGGLGGGQDPLMSGGSGRLWASNNGDVRIELQSDGGGGDVEVVASGNTLWLYHAASNTVYKTTMAPEKKQTDKGQKLPPTVAAVKRVLRQLGSEATTSGAVPDNVAGQPAYSTRIDPKANGGLVGGADVTWDAANGAPLRVAIFARGQNSPVLAIEATDVSFGAVDPSVFAIQPPAGATVQELNPSATKAHAEKSGKKPARPITGLAAVTAAAPFTVSAPAELAGQKRTGVMLIGAGPKKRVVVRYGKGLGGITVMESAAGAKPVAAPASKTSKRDSLQIPTAKIGAADGTVLGTALGSVVSFTRSGVSYVVIGSVTSQDALAAARGL